MIATYPDQKYSTTLLEAKTYLQNYYKANDLNGFSQRWRNVEAEVLETGTYWQTKEELEFGAKVAWRNSNRCIGRLFWKTLKVLDFRHVKTEGAFLDAIETHLTTAQATNKIRSVISIFPPNTTKEKTPFRILNYTLIQYAGYPSKGGGVIGDPKHLAFTKLCLALGWSSRRTAFDILPVVWQDQNGNYSWYQLPEALIQEVPF
ncbi:MAG: nitric oxide synthase oxygenase, partial [Bacteroidota bacterium]